MVSVPTRCAAAITRVAAGVQCESPSQGITRPDAIRIRQEACGKGHAGGSQTSQKTRPITGLKRGDLPILGKPNMPSGQKMGAGHYLEAVYPLDHLAFHGLEELTFTHSLGSSS